MQRHDRIIRERDFATRAILFYERGIARIDDRWAGTGESGERFIDDQHLYANDLDLFGRGSLFELLSIARTRAGEETLAAWLTAPAAPPEIRARRDAVTELTPAIDLRERVALAGTDVRAGIHSEALVGWAEAPPVLRREWPRSVAAALAAAAVGAAVWWSLTGDAGPFIMVVVVEIAFSMPLRRARRQGAPCRRRPGARSRHPRARPPAARGAAVRRAAAARVAEQSRYRRRGRPPGRSTGCTGSSSGTTGSTTCSLRSIGAVLLWGTQIAFAIEHWRRRHGAHVAIWLRAVAEFEALSSLAAYRYEHPQDPFPEIVETGPSLYDGIELGHPLIPAARMVRNDVRLTPPTRLFVVSGSNMSGKSTLLRTVGINAVLAFAGAPVRARALRLTPLVTGATLRIQDSLQEGRSRFYAEITRIRQIADAAARLPPVLFLLDELFHGTNSHDRLVGASGVLRSLIDRGAIGLITTHDLALTSVADELAPRAQNVHFEDHFEGGEIHFDYRMKPGPVARSNAIALMRAVGLDVDQGVRHE